MLVFRVDFSSSYICQHIIILNINAQTLRRTKEVVVFCGILFSTVIYISIKTLKRGGGPKSSRGSPVQIARILPTVLLELTRSLNIQAGHLRKHLLLWFSLQICNTNREDRIQTTFQWQFEGSTGKGSLMMTLRKSQILAGFDGRFIVQSGGTSVLVHCRSDFFNYCIHKHPK